MLVVAWVVPALLVTVVLTAWAVFTATRLARLHARVDAAAAALDAQLLRRAAALARAAPSVSTGAPCADTSPAGLAAVAGALRGFGPERRDVENE